MINQSSVSSVSSVSSDHQYHQYHPSIHPSVRPSIPPSIPPSIHPSIHPPTTIIIIIIIFLLLHYLHLYLSNCFPICLMLTVTHTQSLEQPTSFLRLANIWKLCTNLRSNSPWSDSIAVLWTVPINSPFILSTFFDSQISTWNCNSFSGISEKYSNTCW